MVPIKIVLVSCQQEGVQRLFGRVKYNDIRRGSVVIARKIKFVPSKKQDCVRLLGAIHFTISLQEIATSGQARVGNELKLY
jgi:hypothetical protein